MPKRFGLVGLYSLKVLCLLIKKGVGKWPDDTLATCLQKYFVLRVIVIESKVLRPIPFYRNNKRGR